jgi:hypothetical protein
MQALLSTYLLVSDNLMGIQPIKITTQAIFNLDADSYARPNTGHLREIFISMKWSNRIKWVSLTKAAITKASSISMRRRIARFVTSLVKTANAEVIKRTQVTTFRNGPRSSLDPGFRGMGW